MGELADEQNEANARRMQEPDQAHALAERMRPWQPFLSVDEWEKLILPAENTERRE